MTERITLIEIDVDRCANRFGVAPCTAVASEPDVIWSNDSQVYVDNTIPGGTSSIMVTVPNPTRFDQVIEYTQTITSTAFMGTGVSGTIGIAVRPVSVGSVGIRFRCTQVVGGLPFELGDAFVDINYDGTNTTATLFDVTGPLEAIVNYFDSYQIGYGFACFQMPLAGIVTAQIVSGLGEKIYFQSMYYGPERGVEFVRNYERCFNSRATCIDKPNYSSELVTVRHSTQTGKPNPSLEAVPCLSSVNERPAKLALGESIGTRASITASYKDCRFPDTGQEGDYYRDLRDYDPFETGTYWGKFRARFPFLQGSQARLLQGTTDQLPEEMETRHFIVDTFAGPDSNGNVSLVLKDALKLADSKKAQAPLISIGALSTDILSTDTSITLSPIGAGDEYPSSGVIAIGGDEIATYSGRTSDTLTGLVRGSFNTTAIDQTAGARVQLCLQYTAQKVTAIISDLLVNYARVPASYIPLAAWTEEDDAYIQRQYSALIAEPTAVNELINELLEQTASSVWWDDSVKLMQFRVLKSVDGSAALYDDNRINADSFSSADQNDKRVSQVWTYYGQINPLEAQDDPSNYSRSQVTISPESEQNFEGTPSIKRIYSRWITETGADAAQRLNLLILSRYTTPPRLISLSLMLNQALTVPQLGSGYRVSSWTMQDPTGRTSVVPVQVVQVKTDATTHRVIAEEVLYSETVAPDDPNVKRISIDSTRTNLNLYETALAAPFLPPQTGDTYIFTISPGVVVGSESTDTYSLDTDNRWPEGVNIQVIISDGVYVVGRGGAGGSATLSATFGAPFMSAQAGQPGGPALLARYPVTIDNQGSIGGGGGGGGSGASYCAEVSTGGSYSVQSFALSAGPSGAGYIPAAGGIYSNSSGYESVINKFRLNGNVGSVTSGGVGVSGSATLSFSGFSATSSAASGTAGSIGQNGASGSANAVMTGGWDDPATDHRSSAGGAAGAAVVGDSFITWTNTGTRLGAIT